MIFIASDCVGARMYELLNQQYNNPFCWSRLSYKDFIFLAENLHKINFNNVRADIVHNPKRKERNNKVGILYIDNRIKLLFPHYIQNPNCDKPTKKDISVYYNNIRKYTLDKYKNRVKRMDLNDEICLILRHKVDMRGYNILPEHCKDYIKKKLPYHKILITHDETLLSEQNTDTDIIICKQDATTKSIAQKILSGSYINIEQNENTDEPSI